MADKKISDLTLLTAADATDVVPLVDVSTNTTKKTTVGGLAAAVGTSIPAGTLSFSQGDGKTWWEELGRSTLSAAGDSITVSGLPPRRYLRIIFATSWTTGAVSCRMQFNGDTGANYAYRVSRNGAADGTATSSTSLVAIGVAAAERIFLEADAINVTGREKQVQMTCTTEGTLGAANAPNRNELTGKWANTATQISSVTVFNDGPGDYNSTVGNQCELIVLGHD